MDLAEHHILKVERTAHYYTYGTLTGNTRFVWVVCHGYGQAADRFISKFDKLDPAQNFVIAPEGLSRFYWKGVTGIPVASWMTSKDRESEIDDQMRYLMKVMSLYTDRTQNVQFVFFGFSQGCATIMRFLDHSRHPFSKIILWGGSIPPDINYDTWNSYLEDERVHLIYGDADEYITAERRVKMNEFLEAKGPPVFIHSYQGGHRVIPEVFVEIVSKILVQ